MLGALGVRRSFSRSFVGGVATFWPMCWSMTSQAAGRGDSDHKSDSFNTELSLSEARSFYVDVGSFSLYILL